MCSEPMIFAPASGLESPYFSRMAMRPGISCSWRRISARPSVASERSRTLNGSRPAARAASNLWVTSRVAVMRTELLLLRKTRDCTLTRHDAKRSRRPPSSRPPRARAAGPHAAAEADAARADHREHFRSEAAHRLLRRAAERLRLARRQDRDVAAHEREIGSGRADGARRGDGREADAVQRGEARGRGPEDRRRD